MFKRLSVRKKVSTSEANMRRERKQEMFMYHLNHFESCPQCFYENFGEDFDFDKLCLLALSILEA
jgi:hypothetical protein